MVEFSHLARRRLRRSSETLLTFDDDFAQVLGRRRMRRLEHSQGLKIAATVLTMT